MSRTRLRIHNTDEDNLVSNLRGEVGDIVSTWALMRKLTAEASRLRDPDPEKWLDDEWVLTLDTLTDKLRDEIIARLSELAERKIGRLTFHFAFVKLNSTGWEVCAFREFIEERGFREKRNYDISHKELPEKWTEHRDIDVPYKAIVKATAMALRLMKRIDSLSLGPSAKYLWREMRKRRYGFPGPAKAQYLLLPYLRLSKQDRARVVAEEAAAGLDVWEDVRTVVNGKRATVKANKEWGVVALGSRLLVLDEYPLNNLASIEMS